MGLLPREQVRSGWMLDTVSFIGGCTGFHTVRLSGHFPWSLGFNETQDVQIVEPTGLARGVDMGERGEEQGGPQVLAPAPGGWSCGFLPGKVLEEPFCVCGGVRGGEEAAGAACKCVILRRCPQGPRQRDQEARGSRAEPRAGVEEWPVWKWSLGPKSELGMERERRAHRPSTAHGFQIRKRFPFLQA